MDDPQFRDDLDGRFPKPSGAYTHRLPFSANPDPEPSSRRLILGATIAIVLILLIVGKSLLRAGRVAPNAQQNLILPADPYAPYLVFTQLAMSESTSLSGGKSTFIDGHVRNDGPDTLTGVTIQVLFRSDVGLAPQVENVPLSLIRTHEPYIDVEPVSAAPLTPGNDVEFRLIFETVGGSWNQQMPTLQVIRIVKR